MLVWVGTDRQKRDRGEVNREVSGLTAMTFINRKGIIVGFLLDNDSEGPQNVCFLQLEQ